MAHGEPKLLFCDNETNAEKLFGIASASPTPKDGINDHVVAGADTVAAAAGTKAAFWYEARVEPGETVTLRSGSARPRAAAIRGPTSTPSRRRASPTRTSSTPS